MPQWSGRGRGATLPPVNDRKPAPVLQLLEALVAARSPSREEGPCADVLQAWLSDHGCEVVRTDRNLVVVKDSALPGPTLLLCSHIDTVPATAAWTRDPWGPTRGVGDEAHRLYGLGANDAKASVAAMAVAFEGANPRRGKLIFAAVCEEEVGRGGLEALLPSLDLSGEVLAIIGEPTGLDIATAQNGLLILDCVAHGRAGHAARPQLAENAIYAAARDVLALEALAGALDRVHPLAGRATLAVTIIHAGERHNVIPGEARYLVDLRTTPSYTNEELLALVRGAVGADVSVRSDRFRAVQTPEGAPVLDAAEHAMSVAGRSFRRFHSPTLSDWAHLGQFATIKWGPGLSEVSHTADEWVDVRMVEDAACLYSAVVANLLGCMKSDVVTFDTSGAA